MNLPTVETVWAERWRDPRQRAWLRVAALAHDRAGPHGHASMSTGEIGRLLHLDRQQVSRALDLARREGWLAPTSSARCLVLPGSPPGPCPALHRGGA